MLPRLALATEIPYIGRCACGHRDASLSACCQGSAHDNRRNAWCRRYDSQDPFIGDLIVGTGGCRKLRFAKKHGGKSGGYRVITYYGGEEIPVFLVTVFGKNEKANLSHAERNGLAAISAVLADEYRDTMKPRKR